MFYSRLFLQLCLFSAYFGSCLVQADQSKIVIQNIEAIDLGTLHGGDESRANDINDACNIVGSSETEAGETHAFYLSNWLMTDLNTLPEAGDSAARGINDYDQVVGVFSAYAASAARWVNHAFEWEAGTMRDLGTYQRISAPLAYSTARAINNHGLISGNIELAGVVLDLYNVSSDYPPFPAETFVMDGSSGFHGPNYAADINNAGQVAGGMYSNGPAFRWQGGVIEPLAVSSDPYNFEDRAHGINDRGEVVGRGVDDDTYHVQALYWPTPAIVHDLGTLGGDRSLAYDINNNHFIVGRSDTDTGESRGFVWHSDFGMKSLGTLGGANSFASAINSHGHIVGASETSDGNLHATLWLVRYGKVSQISDRPVFMPPGINDYARSHGKEIASVVMFGTETFDPAEIDLETLAVETGKEEPVFMKDHQLADVNDDGFVDLVSYYQPKHKQDLLIDGYACDQRETYHGNPFIGCLPVIPLPPPLYEWKNVCGQDLFSER